MTFKFLKTDITVSYFFASAVCLLILTDKSGLIVPMITAVILHETGHYIAMLILKQPPKQIKLIIGGIIVVGYDYFSAIEQIFVCASGPLFNILVFLAFYLVGYKLAITKVIIFAFINLIYGLYNILPIRGLDGGSMLVVLLSQKICEDKAYKIVNVITILCALLLFAFAVVNSLYGTVNYSLYLFVLYLILSVFLSFS